MCALFILIVTDKGKVNPYIITLLKMGIRKKSLFFRPELILNLLSNVWLLIICIHRFSVFRKSLYFLIYIYS